MWPQLFLRLDAEKKEEENKNKGKKMQAKFKLGTKKCGLGQVQRRRRFFAGAATVCGTEKEAEEEILTMV